MSLPVVLVSFLILSSNCWAFPDAGKWNVVMTEVASRFSIPKSLYRNSQIYIQVTCDSSHSNLNISIQWILTQTKCWEDFYKPKNGFYQDESTLVVGDNRTLSRVKSSVTVAPCAHGAHILLPPAAPPPDLPKTKITGEQPVFWIPVDGVYLLTLAILPVPASSPARYNVSVAVTMKSEHGYLSAIDWPFLPFYAVMCGVYVALGTGWLVVCGLQWRDLLRIQFWIGAVLLLGMLEKATFLAEYSSINSTGLLVRGAVLAAEWVSVAKRALARMLVIIVSLGFGIVKPRLGPMLQRVVALGGVWGALAALEAWLRLGGSTEAPGDALLAEAPLALVDAALCWWVFTSLVHTTRTLRLRRNMVKLTLYKHFTNTMIFAVMSSLVFMLYNIKVHGLDDCIADWKELWVDDAYWHVLFSVVLLVIMVLWRPTNNNQRYAFTPLLDNPDDDDDEEEQFVSDAYGVKMRGFGGGGGGGGGEAPPSPPPPPSRGGEEADLRWVEDNIPSTVLPVLDSDEEILNTKFEVSKMQ